MNEDGIIFFTSFAESSAEMQIHVMKSDKVLALTQMMGSTSRFKPYSWNVPTFVYIDC